MPKTFIFTGSFDEARKHWEDTVEKGFPLEKVTDILDTERTGDLREYYGGKKARAWGALPGPGNVRNWNDMSEGDTILAYSKGVFVYEFEIILKLHDRALAERLWGTNGEGETWEYLYFLGGMKDIKIPKETMAARLGYKPHWNPYGYSRIADDSMYGSRKTKGPSRDPEMDKDPLEDAAEREVEDELRGKDPAAARQALLDSLRGKESGKDLGTSLSLVERRKRDYTTVNELKHLYGYRCQICGVDLPTRKGGHYIEGAHIQAKSRAGNEHPSNILILCPNHHKLFDHGETTYGIDGGRVVDLMINGQVLSVNYIDGYLK